MSCLCYMPLRWFLSKRTARTILCVLAVMQCGVFFFERIVVFIQAAAFSHFASVCLFAFEPSGGDTAATTYVWLKASGHTPHCMYLSSASHESRLRWGRRPALFSRS